MTSKRSSSDPSTKKPPPPNPNPNPNPNPSPTKKKKKSKSHRKNPNPSPSTPKKMSPPMMASSPAASKKRKAREHDDADSLTILEAIIEFQSTNRGANPTPTNMMPLYESVKDTLHVDYTQDQLYNRIRHLRQKYYRQLDDGKVGPEPAHRAFYDLSLRAWGDSKKRTVASTPTSNGAEKEKEKEKEEKEKKKKKEKEEKGKEEKEKEKEKEEKEKEKEKVAAAEEDDGLVGDEEMEDAENGEGEGEGSFKYLNHQAKEYWRAMGLTAESLEMGLKSMDKVKAELLEKKWVQHGDAGLKIQAKQSEIEKELFLALHATRKGTN